MGGGGIRQAAGSTCRILGANYMWMHKIDCHSNVSSMYAREDPPQMHHVKR